MDSRARGGQEGQRAGVWGGRETEQKGRAAGWTFLQPCPAALSRGTGQQGAEEAGAVTGGRGSELSEEEGEDRECREGRGTWANQGHPESPPHTHPDGSEHGKHPCGPGHGQAARIAGGAATVESGVQGPQKAEDGIPT